MIEMWFVWCSENGRIPTFIHNSIDSAKMEAERLARINPGKEFHVLRSIASCTKQDVKWETMRDIDDSDLPF